MRDVSRTWTDLLYPIVVETENDMANDLRNGMSRSPTPGRGNVMLTPIKAQRLGRTHSRFVDGYLLVVLGGPLDPL